MDPKQIGGRCHLTTPLLLDRLVPPLAIYSAGTLINIVSLKSGAVINSYVNHQAQVVKMIQHPDESDEIISFSVDGHISYWNVHNLQEIHKHQLSIRIYDIIIPSITAEQLYVITNMNEENNNELLIDVTKAAEETSSPKNDKFRLVLYDISKGEIIRSLLSMRFSKNCISIIPYGGENYIVAVNRAAVYFWNINSEHCIRFNTQKLGSSNLLAVNVSKDLLVTAHSNGQLCLWSGIGSWVSSVVLNNTSSLTLVQGKDKPLHTVLHWHSMQLSSLCLSPDGSFMYSGGEEGVLVQWQLSLNNNKVFLPRVGGQICSTASSEQDALVMITTSNNCLLVVDTARMIIDWTIQSLAVIPAESVHPEDSVFQSDSSFTCKLDIEPNSGFLVCSGYPGHLQLFDIYSNTFKDQIEVVQYIHVSRTETDSRIYVPSITHFDFSKVVIDNVSHTFLVTMDVRRGEEIDTEDSLKIWELDPATDKFVEEAQMDRPHGNSRVLSLAMQHVDVGCVTAAADGTIKLWTRTQLVSDGGEAESAWLCRLALKHRDCPASMARFSADDSVLAVAYDNLVTLWDPSLMACKASIVSSTASEIIFAAFVQPISAYDDQATESAYLVMGSRRSIDVVDLLSLKTVTRIEGKFSSFAVAGSDAECLISDKSKSLGWIACGICPYAGLAGELDGETDGETDDHLSSSHMLAIFSLHSAEPLILIDTSTTVQSLVFLAPPASIQSLQRDSSIVFLLASGDMYCVGGSAAYAYTAAAQGTTSTTKLQQVDSDLIGKAQSSEGNQFSAPAPAMVTSFLERYIDRDSSNIAAVTDIYRDFMSNFMPKVTVQSSDDDLESKNNLNLNFLGAVSPVSTDDDMSDEKFGVLRQSAVSLFSRSSMQGKIAEKYTTFDSSINTSETGLLTNTPSKKKRKKTIVAAVDE